MRNTANEVGRIARLLQREINESVLPAGVTRQQYQILSYLYRQEGDVFQRDIEAYFSMPRSTVSGLMKELELSGLIRRCQVESDSRLKRLVLTDQGRRVCGLVRQGMLDLNRQLTGGISDEDFRVFWRVADQMRANLAQA
ncbi:MAG: winged helix-turn-helix transcriptional regulator [Firmicutes bacterium]|nr:winged helix-turn-helix transcriptional regulator [Bacillota bacterium]